VDLDCLEKRLDDIQKSLGFSQKIIQEMKVNTKVNLHFIALDIRRANVTSLSAHKTLFSVNSRHCVTSFNVAD
jgi:uncharacterized protein YebE (UPF0316 family)